MRETLCALHKVNLSLFFALFFLISAPAYSAPAADDPYEKIQTRLNEIDERVKKIERDQQEVLVREDKILEELTRLRYMTHRK